MKMIFILLMSFFLINSAQADWKQINCIDYVPEEELSLNYKKWIPLSDNLELYLFYKANDSCRYEIRSLNRGRKFTFYKDEFNFIQLRNDFTDQIGIATYFSYPKKTELKVYKDSKTGNVKVIQPNESEIFFSAQSGQIDEQLTKDYNVTQTSFNPTTGGLVLESSKQTLLSINYGPKYGNKTKLHSKIRLSHKQKSCSLEAAQVLDYRYTCEDKINLCIANKKEIIQKRPKAYKKYEADHAIYRQKKLREGETPEPKSSYKSFKADFIDGVILNPDKLKQAINKNSACEKVITPSIKTAKVEKIKKPHTDLKLTPAPAIVFSNTEATLKKVAPSQKRQVKTKAPEKKINQVTQAPIKEKEKLSSKETTSSTGTEDKRNECLNKLSEYFSNQPNTLELDEYLRIQSKISLHRIAWVTMKTSKNNTQNIEKSILSMLEQRDPTLHQSFLKKELKTRNLRLLSVLNELKEASKSFKSPQNIPFQLKYADLKMMHLLVETENKFGRSYNQGARDFTSIINNSMKNRLNKKEKNTQHFEKIISTLQKKANQIEAKMKTYLEENDCTKESDFLLCGRKNQDIDISQMMSESQSVIDQFYKNQFEYNNELYNNFKWSAKNKNYWLHVK